MSKQGSIKRTVKKENETEDEENGSGFPVITTEVASKHICFLE